MLDNDFEEGWGGGGGCSCRTPPDRLMCETILQSITSEAVWESLHCFEMATNQRCKYSVNLPGFVRSDHSRYVTA